MRETLADLVIATRVSMLIIRYKCRAKIFSVLFIVRSAHAPSDSREFSPSQSPGFAFKINGTALR